MNRRLTFDELAELHVGDLFGRPARRKLQAAGARKSSRPVRVSKLPPTKIPRPDHFEPINCPCCKQTVDAPMLDIVIDHYGIAPSEESVLRAVWKGRGHPVSTERIFDAMYADDPDGGPEPGAMYRALKSRLHNLRGRLAGSGVDVENVGYRQGYRLVLAGKE